MPDSCKPLEVAPCPIPYIKSITGVAKRVIWCVPFPRKSTLRVIMTVANRRATTWATRSLFPLSLDFARSWTRIIMVSSQARRWGFLARMVRGEGFQSCLYNCSFSHGPLQALGAWTPGLRFLRLCRLNAPLLSRNCCSHSSITYIPRIVVRTLSIKLLRVLCLQIGVRPRLPNPEAKICPGAMLLRDRPFRFDGYCEAEIAPGILQSLV